MVKLPKTDQGQNYFNHAWLGRFDEPQPGKKLQVIQAMGAPQLRQE